MSDPVATASTTADPGSVVSAYSNRLAKPWHVSDALLSFLGEWESGVLNGLNFQNQRVTDGFILKAYLDDRGNPTVGMGHLIVSSDNIAVGQTITIDRARQLARTDLALAEGAVNRRVMVPLLQFEYDSLVSLTFNSGSGHGIDDLVEKVNTGQYEKMFDFIKTFRPGHKNTLAYRRYTEAKMFQAGVYDATH